MSRSIFIILIILVLLLGIFFFHRNAGQPHRTWAIESIDTMKFSRDLAREKLNDKSFDTVIDQQISLIASTGANYVAIGTPYDDEFTPILRRWVASARRRNLHVWFRGNLSGWEQWFSYPKIDSAEHIRKTREFILKNQDLFEDGDIFTSCPECENGADISYSDPSSFENLRTLLLEEYSVTQQAFSQIGRNVSSNYYSMNYDVALRLMDRDTTAKLGGIVVIDHYVQSPVKIADDVRELALKSGGKIVLGEFGAPIPDIHGDMTPAQQDEWIKSALTNLSKEESLTGINYWTNIGGTTALWDTNMLSRPAVSTLTNFYSGKIIN